MKHTTRIEMANLKYLNLAEAGAINPEDLRRVTFENAVVDTGATLKKAIILTTTNGLKTSSDYFFYFHPVFHFFHFVPFHHLSVFRFFQYVTPRF